MDPAFSKPFPPEFLPSHDLDQLPDPPPFCPAVMAETVGFSSAPDGEVTRDDGGGGEGGEIARLAMSAARPVYQEDGLLLRARMTSVVRATAHAGDPESATSSLVSTQDLRGKAALRIVRDADIVLSGMRTPCVAYPAR